MQYQLPTTEVEACGCCGNVKNFPFLFLKTVFVSYLLVFLLYNFEVVYDLRDVNT